jgi:hypothetical protein
MKKDDKYNLIQQVESYTGKSLHKHTDLKLLLEISIQYNLEENFEEMAFTGKYLYGLMNVLKSGGTVPEVGNLDHVKKDMTTNIEKLTNQISTIIDKSGEEIKLRFEKDYLEINQQNLMNLNLLIEDLNQVKKFLNYKKRTS